MKDGAAMASGNREICAWTSLGFGWASAVIIDWARLAEKTAPVDWGPALLLLVADIAALIAGIIAVILGLSAIWRGSARQRAVAVAGAVAGAISSRSPILLVVEFVQALLR